ncbi:MAG: hypothetical protein AAF628_18565 [Planctomycetota bacterium]
MRLQGAAQLRQRATQPRLDRAWIKPELGRDLARRQPVEPAHVDDLALFVGQRVNRVEQPAVDRQLVDHVVGRRRRLAAPR